MEGMFEGGEGMGGDGVDGGEGREGTLGENWRVVNTTTARTNIAKKRFSFFAKELYNSRRAPQNVSATG